MNKTEIKSVHSMVHTSKSKNKILCCFKKKKHRERTATINKIAAEK